MGGSPYIAAGCKYLNTWHQGTSDATSSARGLRLPLHPAPGKRDSKKIARWMVGRKCKLCSFRRLWKGKQRSLRIGLVRAFVCVSPFGSLGRLGLTCHSKSFIPPPPTHLLCCNISRQLSKYNSVIALWETAKLGRYGEKRSKQNDRGEPRSPDERLSRRSLGAVPMPMCPKEDLVDDSRDLLLPLQTASDRADLQVLRLRPHPQMPLLQEYLQVPAHPY